MNTALSLGAAINVLCCKTAKLLSRRSLRRCSPPPDRCRPSWFRFGGCAPGERFLERFACWASMDVIERWLVEGFDPRRARLQHPACSGTNTCLYRLASASSYVGGPCMRIVRAVVVVLAL